MLTWTKGNFSPAAGQVAYACTFHPGATDGELGPVTFTTAGLVQGWVRVLGRGCVPVRSSLWACPVPGSPSPRSP